MQVVRARTDVLSVPFEVFALVKLATCTCRRTLCTIHSITQCTVHA